MRICALISLLAAIATAVAGAVPAKRDSPGQRFSRTVHGVTNAELLRRGLPLKDPIIRRGAFLSMRHIPPPILMRSRSWRLGTPVRRTSPSDTSISDSDPQTDTTTTTTTTIVHRGNILVKKADDGSPLGYVSTTLSFGQFAYQDISHALAVSFTTDSTGSGDKLNLIIEVGFGLPQSRAALSYPVYF